MKIHQKGRKRHDTIFREKFGLGLTQYEQLYEEQGGRCYICGKKETRNLAVDHDHKTGKVRRLLCMDCNTGIGKFKDDASLVKKALEYLQTEFDLPPDRDEPTVEQDDKPRWRNIVFTPEGTFSSTEAAGRHYNVHSTSIARWCGMYEYFSGSKKDGWTSERVYDSMNNVKQNYPIIE